MKSLRLVAVCSLVVSLLSGGGSGAAAQSTGITVEDSIIVESRDGTPIVARPMLPAGASKSSPVPVVLQTHGWGGTRAKTPSVY